MPEIGLLVLGVVIRTLIGVACLKATLLAEVNEVDMPSAGGIHHSTHVQSCG